MKSIYGIVFEDLEQYFLNIGEKKFKASQVFSWLYQKKATSFDSFSDMKLETIKKLKNDFYFMEGEQNGFFMVRFY